MNHLQGKPVIIGSGLSGMMISFMLSRSRIEHVMIGGPPDQSPRLGESLNLDGTLGLLEFFPDFSQYYYPKRYSVGYLGDYTFICTFTQGRPRLISRIFFTLLGYQTPVELIQFDRLGFDDALYKRVCASSYCHSLHEWVKSVVYEPSTDRITKICLANGDDLEPSYIFDATNHGRFVGQAANVPCHMMGHEQRVVYTHYHADNDDANYCEEWEYSTNIIALTPEKDALQGLAWCIPLGRYVSIGIQVKASDDHVSNEELLTIAEEAYARRGLHYRRRYPHPTKVTSLNHRFFLHERAYGGNWLLAGTAYCQIWWMSGAGVGMALSAAQVAAQMLVNPKKIGRLYQEYLRGLLELHRIFDWFVLTDPSLFTAEEITSHADRLVTSNLRRVSRATWLRRNPINMVFGWLFSRLVTVKGYCRAIKTELAKQTEQTFQRPYSSISVKTSPSEESVMNGQQVQIVEHLLPYLVERKDLSEAGNLVCADVISHMDHYTVRGRGVWMRWVHFINTRRRVTQLDVLLERLVVNPDETVTAYGRWKAICNGEAVVSPEISATYRIRDGKIVEIWTKSTNYTFMLGLLMQSRLGLVAILLYFKVWCLLHPAGVDYLARARQQAR